MKTKKNTKKMQKDGGGLGSFLRNKFWLKTKQNITQPSTQPIIQPTIQPIKNDYNLEEHLSTKKNLIELLKNQKALEFAMDKLKIQKNKLKDIQYKTKEDNILIHNIDTDIKKLTEEIDKLKEKIKSENSRNSSFYNKYSLNQNGPETNKKKRFELNQEINRLKKEEKKFFNNNTKATYKKYSQFREGLFNNIIKHKIDIKKNNKTQKKQITNENKNKLALNQKKLALNQYKEIYKEFIKKLPELRLNIKLLHDKLKVDNLSLFNKNIIDDLNILLDKIKPYYFEKQDTKYNEIENITLNIQVLYSLMKHKELTNNTSFNTNNALTRALEYDVSVLIKNLEFMLFGYRLYNYGKSEQQELINLQSERKSVMSKSSA
jgi:hypothetical protein